VLVDGGFESLDTVRHYRKCILHISDVSSATILSGKRGD
jgi:hypothetical protein